MNGKGTLGDLNLYPYIQDGLSILTLARPEGHR